MTTEEKLKKAMEIIEHTETMRGFQKAYFKNRLQGDLKHSKQYESLVDREIAALKNNKGEPPTQEVMQWLTE